jgi:hypothetical protein
LEGAEILDFIPLSLVPWINSGRKGACRASGLRLGFFFRRSRGFLRTHDFTFRARNTLVVLLDNGTFFDFPTFRTRRKRSQNRVVL